MVERTLGNNGRICPFTQEKRSKQNSCDLSCFFRSENSKLWVEHENYEQRVLYAYIHPANRSNLNPIKLLGTTCVCVSPTVKWQLTQQFKKAVLTCNILIKLRFGWAYGVSILRPFLARRAIPFFPYFAKPTLAAVASPTFSAFSDSCPFLHIVQRFHRRVRQTWNLRHTIEWHHDREGLQRLRNQHRYIRQGKLLLQW